MAEKSPMRVLHIITVPISMTGLPLFALRVGAAMRGVRSDFLSYGQVDERAIAALGEGGQRVFTAPHRLRNPLRYARFVSRVIRDNGYDVVHCHGNSATMALDLLAAKMGGAKVRIAHAHNTSTKAPLLHRLLNPLFQKLCTCRMACGEEAGRWLFGNRSFQVIPNGIVTESFRYDAVKAGQMRRECGFMPEDCVIGWAGSFVEQKNLLFLLDCFHDSLAKMPALRLALIGDGPLREQLMARVDELGIGERVWMPGARADMPRLLLGMDLMALPSLYEGFPTVALEWQCSGLPCLLADTITPDCVMVPFVKRLPLDRKVWSDAIRECLGFERQADSDAGIRAVREAGYDIDNTAQTLRREYQRLLNGNER